MLHPVLRRDRGGGRTPEARLAEAVGLARAIDLEIAHADTVRVDTARPATLFGQGAVERLKGLVAAAGAGLAFVDGTVSPVQQRNLEKAWQCKVIDRTGLILEIFGARARTAEGRLQVELAQLTYQRSRLVRTWTHLERQRGGFGFLAGPGETQLETDRRLLGDRIERLQADLEKVRRTRGLHREARKRVPYPVVALVGYTNAGKSTLFNRLARAEVGAADLLFATLDPTMRRLELPSGRTVILSDTVGFISDLPTHLVAAFRATLEEVSGADLLLHVRDVSHPDTAAQREDVLGVLADLGIDPAGPVIEVLNKIDALPPEAHGSTVNQAAREPRVAAVSAATGEGLDRLLDKLDAALGARNMLVDVALPFADGAGRAWLHRHGEVVEETSGDDGVTLRVILSPEDRERFKARQRRGK